MKLLIKFFIVLLIVGIGALFFHFAICPSSEKEIEIVEKFVSYEDSKRQVNICIPQFQNMDEALEEKINQKIYEEINEQSVYAQMTAGREEEEIGLFVYEATYSRFDVQNYISIVVNQYIHLGEGRPRIQKKCYVVDIQKNQIVSLMDVVAPLYEGQNYKAVLVEEINKQASNQGIELIGGNGLTKLSDTQPFYIKDGNIIVYFEASEIAAAAVGELEFKVASLFSK